MNTTKDTPIGKGVHMIHNDARRVEYWLRIQTNKTFFLFLLFFCNTYVKSLEKL